MLIVDEFGKGTEPDDGAGLFCGVVEYLLKLGLQAVSWTTTLIALIPGSLTNRLEMLQPRTVFATHFQRTPPRVRHGVMYPSLTLDPRVTDVFLNGVLSRQLPFVLAHMEVFVDDRETKRSVSGTDTEETAGIENLTYLYR